MKADDILALLRPLVLVVDGSGTITDHHGGFGGVHGFRPGELVGSSVFDHVVPDQVEDLVTYFAESMEASKETVAFPLPFRLMVVDTDGLEHPADIIPAGHELGPDGWGWVVAVVPGSLMTATTRSLDAEMAGAPRQRVKALLTEELATDNHSFSTRWFLVDLSTGAPPTVVTSRDADQPMVDALVCAVTENRWRPWTDVTARDTVPVDFASLPDTVRAVGAARGWRRVSVTPVHLDGNLVAAYLKFGRVPDDFDVNDITANVRHQAAGLVDLTALLMARWRERDRLVEAATLDPLTGLANRDAFSNALAKVGERAALLYIDIDDFKPVNDHFGHKVGDQVLCEVANRIVEACRPVDLVARLGGDEFVVLLEDVDAAGAHTIGQRIVDASSAPVIAIEGRRPVTVSVGLTVIDGIDHAVDAADRAMLQAKRAGRNRLVAAI